MAYILDLTDPKVNLFSSVLKRYNMSAYKYFVFKVVPELRKGNLIGDKVEDNKYFIELPFGELFSKVYGVIGVYYIINDKYVNFEINNRNLFFELYRRVCPIKCGVPIIDDKAEFKLKLYTLGICTK